MFLKTIPYKGYNINLHFDEMDNTIYSQVVISPSFSFQSAYHFEAAKAIIQANQYIDSIVDLNTSAGLVDALNVCIIKSTNKLNNDLAEHLIDKHVANRIKNSITAIPQIAYAKAKQSILDAIRIDVRDNTVYLNNNSVKDILKQFLANIK